MRIDIIPEVTFYFNWLMHFSYSESGFFDFCGIN